MATQWEQIQPIHLRATTPGDLDFVIRAEQDPDNRRFILPWTREQHAAALTDTDFRHLIIEHSSSSPSGFVLLAGLANAHGCLEFRRIVVIDQRKGIGRAADLAALLHCEWRPIQCRGLFEGRCRHQRPRPRIQRDAPGQCRPSMVLGNEHALVERRREMVEFLLQHGAATNLPGDEPWAKPLTCATRCGHSEIVELLKQHGAT